MKLEEMSKKDRTIHWLQTHPLNLRCFHCHERLNLDNSSLLCANNHRYDIAKQGYYYLAKAASSVKYNRTLYQSRREIINASPLYNELHQEVSRHLNQHTRKLLILDAGSGEGSHLKQLETLLKHENTLIGTDLSKDAIQYATDYNGEMFSFVGDLANLPIESKQIDIVFSIFSPANYAEFDRVLKANGELIKVIPNSGYLQQVRTAMNELSIEDIESYSNQKVLDAFYSHYPDAREVQIKETVNLTDNQIKHLVNMTPLTWQLDSSQKQEVAGRLKGPITLDVSVLYSKG